MLMNEQQGSSILMGTQKCLLLEKPSSAVESA